MKSTVYKYYEKQKPDLIQAGFSDIRMWPGYMAFSAGSLFFAQWLGMFWAVVLVGVPAMILVLKYAGLFKIEAPGTIPRQHFVYEQINRQEKHEKRVNHQARKHMREKEFNKLQAKQSAAEAKALRRQKAKTKTVSTPLRG